MCSKVPGTCPGMHGPGRARACTGVLRHARACKGVHGACTGVHGRWTPQAPLLSPEGGIYRNALSGNPIEPVSFSGE